MIVLSLALLPNLFLQQISSISSAVVECGRAREKFDIPSKIKLIKQKPKRELNLLMLKTF
jgi:hypothetical protein